MLPHSWIWLVVFWLIAATSLDAQQTQPPVASFGQAVANESSTGESSTGTPMSGSILSPIVVHDTDLTEQPAAVPLLPKSMLQQPQLSGEAPAADGQPTTSSDDADSMASVVAEPADDWNQSNRAAASVYVNQPLTTDPPYSANASAEQLIDLVASMQTSGAATGRAWTLLDALSAAPVERRAAIARAYWDCYQDLAQMNTARWMATEVDKLSQPAGLDAVTVQSVQALSRAAIDDAQHQLRESQYQLMRLAPFQPHAEMPLPTSRPLIGEYLTNAGQLTSRSVADPRLIGIDSRLSNTLGTLNSLADAAWQSRQALPRYIAGYNQGQASLRDAITAIEICGQAQSAFFRTAARYNQDIASYAFAVAPQGLPPEQAVAMLIKPSSPNAVALTPNTMRNSSVPAFSTSQTFNSPAITTQPAPTQNGAPQNWNSAPPRMSSSQQPPTSQLQPADPNRATIQPRAFGDNNSGSQTPPPYQTQPPPVQSGGTQYSLGSGTPSQSSTGSTQNLPTTGGGSSPLIGR